MSRARSSVLVDALAIAILHAAACALVRATGFDHVSDDDFARVTIAEAFAHAPRLDPSGTSWLPFPFWTLGTLLAILGRSLSAARVASIALASVAAPLPYVALRASGVPRVRSLAAAAFALLSPWALWLGAATVPESVTASMTAAAVIALGAAPDALGALDAPSPSRGHVHPGAQVRRLGAFAVLLVCACLSRYEPWPVAAVLAIVLGARAARTPGRLRPLLCALAIVCALGPLAWMAWNAHAHDGPLHFFRRVSSFKRAIGGGSEDTLGAVLLYPRLFAAMRPDVLFATAFALPFLRREAVRRRWAVPLACVLAQLVFLAYGNVRGGAPAHHAERALLEASFVLALFAADVLGDAATGLGGRPRRIALACASLVVASWLVAQRPLFGAPPGSTPAEDRAPQIARGVALRGARHLVVEPCAFEHFALLAAYGAPEDAEVLPRTNAPVTPECPRVEAR